MISFRNHVATLLAVFLALAVGVVLGGGPLSEVGRDALATSSTDSRTGPAKPDVRVEYGDAFAAATAPRLYREGLAGRPVALVTLPGAPSGTVSGLTEQVEAAAGRLTGTYAMRPALVAAGDKSLVDTLGSQLLTQLGPGVADRNAPTYDRMGQLLGVAIASTRDGGVTAGEPALAIRQSLVGAELATIPNGTPDKAPLVLVVLGEDADDDILAGLLAGLARRAVGVVTVGDTRSGTDGDLAALRADPLAEDVATVDGAEHDVGRVSAVLALIGSLRTTGGAFGASGSDGAVPLG